MNKHQQVLLNRLTSILGYGFILWTIIRCLIWPAQHVDFLFHTGAALLIGELAAIIGTVLLNTERPKPNIWELLVGMLFVGMWAYVAAQISGNSTVTILLTVSFAVKYLLGRVTSDNQILLLLVVFSSTLMIWLLLAPLLNLIAQPSPPVMLHRPLGGSEHPQVMLLWGLLYYSLLIAGTLHPPKRLQLAEPPSFWS